jgi:hypothetical protein
MAAPTLDDLKTQVQDLQPLTGAIDLIEMLYHMGLLNDGERTSILVRVRAKLRAAVDKIPRDTD